MVDVTDENHRGIATVVRRLLAVYQEAEDLINIGAYVAGSNPEIDLAIKTHDVISAFLQQGMHEAVDFESSINSLFEVGQAIQQAQQGLTEATANG